MYLVKINRNLNCLFFLITFPFLLIGQIQKNWSVETISKHADYPLLYEIEFEISSQYTDTYSGIHHVYLQQYYHKLPLIPATAGFHFSKEDQLLYKTSSLIENPEKIESSRFHRLDLNQVIQELFKSKNSHLQNIHFNYDRSQMPFGELIDLKSSALDKDEIKAQTCYYFESNSRIVPAYRIYWKRYMEQEWLELVVDASIGQVISESNLILNCDFQNGHFYRENLFQLSNGLNAPLLLGSYNVFALPTESPIHGNRTLNYQPWAKAENANPFGWHGDGINLYYTTRGNNADVYEDSDGDDLPTGGDAARSYGGPQLNFDFVFNPALPPLLNKDASISNLFYWCNVMHDVWYQYGFDEVSGNFQMNNSGRGGAQGDGVISEGIDLINSARNNASFFTPPDGTPGKMQLYVWQPPVSDEMIIEAPASIAGIIKFVHTPISPIIYSPLSRKVIQVNDGSTFPTYACSNLINASELNGNIALVDKGICSFSNKMSKIQSAGAVAVIICNVDKNEPSGFGGVANGISIPAVMISKADCQKIKIELKNGVYISLLPTTNLKFQVNQKSYLFSRTSFGVGISNLSADIIQVLDNLNVKTDACDNIVNGAQLAGKIAMIDDGNCEMSYKAIQTQNLGAVAVIICKQSTGYPDSIPKGSYGHLLQIPVISLSKSDCEEIKLYGNSIGQFKNTSPQLLDGNFDAGIICHEYAHGISNRLIGGPANVSCLTNAEQMGEGWSDYFGMVMTMRPGDYAYQNRGVGVYSSGHTINGVGIRPFPYNVSLAVNPANYSQLTDIVKISQPHGIGYIWCSMLWDMTWALISHYGFEPDIYNVNSSKGNIIAYRLVIDGMKLQNCNPGFVDGRNAILKADSILYNGVHSCLIWNVFARRGLGYNANQGSSFRRDDGIPSSSLPPNCSFISELDLFSSVVLSDYELILLAQSENNGIQLKWKMDPFYSNYNYRLSKRTEIQNSVNVILNSNQFNESGYLDTNVLPEYKYYYKLEVYDKNKVLKQTDWVSAKWAHQNSNWSCYPNPVKDVLNLEPGLIPNSHLELKLYNSNLSLVEKSNLDYKKGDLIQLNCRSIPIGLYFIEIKSGNVYQTLKFVKI